MRAGPRAVCPVGLGLRLRARRRVPGGGRGCDPPRLPQVLPYDYCGAYGRRAHEDYTYGRLLGQEYTFSVPPHHDVVGAHPQGAERWAALRAGRGGARGAPTLPAGSLYPHPIWG